MAQIKIPAEFLLQIFLLNDISTKNTELGADSPLAPWLEAQGIDLAADEEAATAAKEQDELRANEETKSRQGNERRDTLFEPVFSFVRAGAQVLKKFYAGQMATLRDWGLPVTESGRIDYPSSFEERYALATVFFTKLASFDDGKSPLAVYIKINNVKVTGLVENNTDANKMNTDAVRAAKAAENATEQRDLLWKAPLQHIHAIADYLKSIYPTNPRALGEWGFVVDEGERSPKLRKSKLKLGETKTVTGVAIGSILTNTGQGEIVIYKGKGTAGEAATLKPGDKMGMLKGYSVITVVNPSTLENGDFTVEMNK